MQVVTTPDSQLPADASKQPPATQHTYPQALLAMPVISKSGWAASAALLKTRGAVHRMLEVLDMANEIELNKQGQGYGVTAAAGSYQDLYSLLHPPRFCREGLWQGLTQLLRACRGVAVPLSRLSGSGALPEFLQVVGEVGCFLMCAAFCVLGQCDSESQSLKNSLKRCCTCTR